MTTAIPDGSGGGPVIEVLLSTYQGERHLGPLVESLANQTERRFRLRVRDDGSTDGTVPELRRLTAGRLDAEIDAGPNRGAAQSFLSLLRRVPPGVPMATFCDQDDVWDTHRLEWGMAALEGVEGPALYCSRVVVADESLEPLRLHPLARRGPSFANALVENVATGATLVLNRPAIDLAVRERPDRILMHDAWLYLLISGCGTVIYDPRPQVLYRQHAANAIGVAAGLEDWRRRARRHAKTGHERALTAQAEELHRLYADDLQPGPRRTLERFLSQGRSPSGRLRYGTAPDAYRQRRADDWVFRLLYGLGRM